MKKIIMSATAAAFLLSAGYAISSVIIDHDHATDAVEHSGGTNSDGCHTNHKTGDYHCHNPK